MKTHTQTVEWTRIVSFAGGGGIRFMTSVYFSSEEGGEDPRIGDFGDTGEGGLAKLRCA